MIDLSLYWRPVAYSIAIAAVDAVCFEGAPVSLLESISAPPDFAQHLIRALLFRIVTDLISSPTEFDAGTYKLVASRALRAASA